ncbi:MAG TPA: hypothetical protein VG942_10465 [Hyphomonadaceae bacterium]|nr:hypothetical protein [Hyphomonadaceae bacterium]
MNFSIQPVLLAVTVVNVALLGFLLAQPRAVAAPEPRDGILRGKGLQIVDDSGKVRASITIMPSEKLKDGSTYPETVLLRLITNDGRPTVKIAAMTSGSGMSLADGKGLSYVQVLAEKDDPQLNIVDKDGKKKTALP